MKNTHHRGGIRHHSNHSGRSNLFYLYEDEPKCYCNGIPCTCPLDVGALERDNPVPPGRYWVDIFGLNIPSAAAWFKAMSGLGVHVDATETFPAMTVPETRNWYLFTVKANPVPVVWDQPRYGFLTVAGPEVKSSADTAQTPALPLDPLDELETFAQSIGSMVGVTSKAGAIALTAGLFLGAGYALLEYLKKGKK